MASSATALADRFVAFRKSTDHAWALWEGDLSHIEEWDDLTALDARRAQLNEFADAAERVAAGDRHDERLAATVAFTARSEAIQLQWREELAWLNHAVGILPNIFTFLPRYPLVTVEHGDRYLEKIRRLPAFLGRWGERLESGARRGIVPIHHIVEGTLNLLDVRLGEPLSAGPLGRQSPPADLMSSAAERWTRDLHQTLDTAVRDALAELSSVIASRSLPAAQSDDAPGICHLEGGADLYRRLIWAHTSLAIEPEDVHRIGLDQISRLEAEYSSIAGPALGIDDIGTIFTTLRDDATLHYRDAASIVDDASKALARAAESLQPWFSTRPAARCVAVATDQGALAFYSRPSRDGVKPGTFFFNAAEPEMWGTFQLEAVTFHEAIPGHHMQLATALETAGMHPLLSDYYVAAYNEGWGLYSERLADEMGLYSTDLDRIGMLAADSMRACRLVVDTGLHAHGWSRSEAIEFMVGHSPLSVRQVEGEIDRYIGKPGQALGYMIGRLEIDKLRSESQARHGERFDIRRFHDCILSTGSVPLASLRKAVEEMG